MWATLIPKPLCVAVCMTKGTKSVAGSVAWWLGHIFGGKALKSSPLCTEYFDIDR